MRSVLCGSLVMMALACGTRDDDGDPGGTGGTTASALGGRGGSESAAGSGNDAGEAGAGQGGAATTRR